MNSGRDEQKAVKSECQERKELTRVLLHADSGNAFAIFRCFVVTVMELSIIDVVIGDDRDHPGSLDSDVKIQQHLARNSSKS